MIIGLTGKNAAGKGEVAAYLKTKGFIYYSLSDVIREEAIKRNLDHSRDNLIKLGNELREKFGASYLAQQINNKIKQQLEKFNKKNSIKIKNQSNNNINNKNNSKNDENKINELNFVIDSIRSPFEAKELMKNVNFILVGIDAPIELRFERMKERDRLGDARTVEELRQQEQRENLKSHTNQQLDETFKLAEKVIVNERSLKELHKKIEELLGKLKR